MTWTLEHNPRCPYRLLLRFPFSQQVVDTIKQFPGVVYAPEYGRGAWTAPPEAIGWLEACASKAGHSLQKVSGRNVPIFGGGEYNILSIAWHDSFTRDNIANVAYSPTSNKPGNLTLYPYQVDAVNAVCQSVQSGWTGVLLAIEMGLGKTAIAIEIVKRLRASRVLVIGPAVTRQVWAGEVAKWGLRLPCVICDAGASAPPRPGAPAIAVTSYSLFGSSGKKGAQQRSLWYEWQPEVTICDESHMLSNAKSGRSKAVADLRRKLPGAVWLCLTGTPVANEPNDLWHQLDLLYPERYGSHFRFQSRYAIAESSAYSHSGFSYHGLNDAYADELRDRLSYVSIRVTKKQVAHLLPPFTILRVPVAAAGQAASDLSESAYTTWLENQRDVRLEACIEWVETAISGSPHLAILTHFRETARRIEASLQDTYGKRVSIGRIDGALSPDKREQAIRHLHEQPSSIVICTMDSVGVGINALAAYSQVLFAELSYWPATVLQALARFYRLGYSDPVTVSVLVSPAILDQAIEYSLRQKSQNIMATIGAGASEDGLSTAVTAADDGWLDRIAALTEGAALSEVIDE